MPARLARPLSAGTLGRVLLLLSLAAAPFAAVAASQAHFSRASVAFGFVSQGFPSPTQPVFVTNTGDAALAISTLAIGGNQPGDFSVAPTGTCGPPASLAPGERCRIDLVMRPFSARNRAVSATLTVQTDGTPASSDIELNGTVDPVLTGAIFVPTPSYLDFPAQPTGTVAGPLSLAITDAVSLTFTIEQFGLVGGDAADFSLSSDCHIGQALARNQTCTAMVTFAPQASGPRSTELVAQFGFSGVSSAYHYSVTGVGGGAAVPVNVVEYYNAVLDHYFITWVAAEQANLDAGNTPTRWTRTGYSFRAYTAAQAGTSPVCRYYIPPPYGDSHFFGRGTAECDATGIAHPQFTLESSTFMHIFLPVGGACAPGTTPVYRVFSNRPDANHRYMTDRAVRDQMVARGWLAEGDGADLVVMCAV